jgi:MOSC domain-containing protein YiiM
MSADDPMSGKIEALWIKRAHRGVMDPADAVTLVEGMGIDTDANFGRSKRQVTVIEKEVFDRIREHLPDVEPYMRRANVMVSGIRLENSRDQVLHLGDVRIRLYGETRPCERMDAQVPGLTAALDPDWGGGAYGVVLDDGEIRVGDGASLTPAAD